MLGLMIIMIVSIIMTEMKTIAHYDVEEKNGRLKKRIEKIKKERRKKY